MKDTKFVKAKCRKTGKRFGLEVKQFGGVWKVVNFVDLNDEEAALITSDVRQASFETNVNLQPCTRCGKRKVGGCTCAPKDYNCTRGGYNFQCVYCNSLELDYSAAAATRGYKDGDVIKLSQGQEVKIRLSDNRPLTQIEVGIGWDPVKQGRSMDVDSSVIVEGNGQKEIIYFGNLTHPSGCVVHHGDNLTGEDGEMQGDDENITVKLGLVPSNRSRLFFVLNIYDCKERRQQLGDVKNMYIRLYDPVSKRAIIEYTVDHNMFGSTALIIGVATRQGSDWTFKAIGRGSTATDIRELADEVVRLRY